MRSYSSGYQGRPFNWLEVFQLILHLVEGRLQHQAPHEVLGVLLDLHESSGGDGCTERVTPQHYARFVIRADHLLEPPEHSSPVLHHGCLGQGDRTGVSVISDIVMKLSSHNL